MKILIFLFPFCAFANSISLNQYLDQVSEKHQDYRSAKETFEANTLMANEGDLLLATNLFANATYTDDSRPNLLFNYAKMIDSKYQFGLNKQSSIGLSGRLYYTWENTSYYDMTFNGPPMSIFGTQASPAIDLTFSLWRNFWGSETKTQLAQANAMKAAQKFGASFNMKNILAEAEGNYWNLALARESVKVAKGGLQRATELFKWYKYRASTGLTDKADLLQSEAALEQRKLDLKNAEDAEVLAARNFNSSRDVDSANVPEQLAPMTSASLDQLNIPARAEMRDDTRAALEQSNAAQAADEQTRQSYVPTLDVFGTAAFNNDNPRSDQDQSNAFNNSFSGTRPTQVIGVRFSAPLDVGLVLDARAGHKAAMHAAELNYQRKLFEQEKNWHDLTEKFQQAKGRLAIYDQLEKAQKSKLDYERVRRKQGRTTTQWVIQFETEYEQTQLARIQSMSEILQLLAQMKTYASSTETVTR
jgi:outer membrane protein TolC